MHGMDLDLLLPLAFVSSSSSAAWAA